MVIIQAGRDQFTVGPLDHDDAVHIAVNEARRDPVGLGADTDPADVDAGLFKVGEVGLA